MSAPRYDELKARYDAAQQGHVFAFWDTLSTPEQAAFLAQLAALDVARISAIHSAAVAADEAAKHASADDIEPLPADAFASVVDAPDLVAQYRAVGLDALARGQVAVLLMAGGQGTRLGSSAPKGCYDIGLPSHKSLFQLQAERIRRLQTVAEQEAGKQPGEVKIRWYIMTSEPTHDATRQFFGWGKDGERLDRSKPVNFGLAEDQVVFFKQGVLPCLTEDGKILLESPGKVAVAPGGNGGLYAALREPLTQRTNNLAASSILADLAAQGTQFVHAYGVDNCLVKVADPVFLGACLARSAECGAKVVPKAHPTESVGVVARRGGRFAVVEYSEITPAQAARRDPATGALALRAANIANHFYTRAFLERTRAIEAALAYHVARKQIPSVAVPSGARGKAPGMKLEMFVFDVFPFAERFAVLEGARAEEFSPLKNAPGAAADGPETSRRDLLAQQRRFLEAAGAALAEGVEVELSPLLSYAGEGLESVRGRTFVRSGHAETLSDLAALW
ncbi:UDP-N-acetylglucosamine pyrophosphorylase [Phellopilus nigrolimitatus]|nr:UDP-N-acetylglucosamine pyrophosphorylase [Phellopilus nigrolimitatus]